MGAYLLMYLLKFAKSWAGIGKKWNKGRKEKVSRIAVQSCQNKPMCIT
jgi:hypothetical protein